MSRDDATQYVTEISEPFLPTSSMCLDGQVMEPSSQIIAGGGYSNIWVGNLGGRTVAIKVLREFGISSFTEDIRKKLRRRICREYLVWTSLRHRNVLPCLGFSNDFSRDSTYHLPALISPWMANGTVVDYIEQFPEANRLLLLRGIAEGLYYLHQCVIVHGDLRAGNILVSDAGIPCLSDFGLSRVLRESFGLTTTSEGAGAIRWMAPELFIGKVTTASDVWAYGMTVLEITSGKPPFAELRLAPVVYTSIRDGEKPKRPCHSAALELTDDIWSFCVACWAYEPHNRPSMSYVIECLHLELGRKELSYTPV